MHFDCLATRHGFLTAGVPKYDSIWNPTLSDVNQHGINFLHIHPANIWCHGQNVTPTQEEEGWSGTLQCVFSTNQSKSSHSGNQSNGLQKSFDTCHVQQISRGAKECPRIPWFREYSSGLSSNVTDRGVATSSEGFFSFCRVQLISIDHNLPVFMAMSSASGPRGEISLASVHARPRKKLLSLTEGSLSVNR